MGMGATLQYGSYMLELSRERLKRKTTTVPTASAARATRIGFLPWRAMPVARAATSAAT